MASTIKNLTLFVGGWGIPVALRGASEKQDISLDRALKHVEGEGEKQTATYARLSRIDIETPDEETAAVTVEPINRDAKGKIKQAQYPEESLVRGVWDGDEFTEIADDKIEEIETLSKIEALTIEEFIQAEDIPWERAQASYYFAPGSRSTTVIKQMALLAKAMEDRRVVGVGKMMPKSRQKLAVVYPKFGGLMVTVLAYANTFEQVREGAAEVGLAEVDEGALTWAKRLIDALTVEDGVAALAEYRDDQIDLRADLIERARAGKPLTDEEAEEEPAVEPVPASNEVLIATLEASLVEIERRKKGKKKASGTSRRARVKA